MKCEICKFKQNIGNTEETGAALCAYSTYYFPINITDDCHYIPTKKELRCGDCDRLGKDMACMTQLPDDSAYDDGELCMGFVDSRECDFKDILMFWKIHGLYDRKKINSMINDFEKFYEELTEQK